MSNTRTEAERRYHAEDVDGIDSAEFAQDAFVAGAKWQRTREVTDAEVEVAAQLMWKERALGTTTPDYPWRGLAEEGRERLREHARAVLEAAREVQA